MSDIKCRRELEALVLTFMHSFALATNPKAQACATKELAAAGLLAQGSDRKPRMLELSDLEKLPYMKAVRTSCSGPCHPVQRRVCSAFHLPAALDMHITNLHG